MGLLRAAVRAFEMSMKLRVISVFTYLNWILFPLIFAALGLLLLANGGPSRSAYAILGGGLIGYWTMAYLEGGNDIQNERWNGTLEQVMGCPTPLPVIVVGKMLSSLTLGAFSFLPAIVLASAVFHRGLSHVDLPAFTISFVVLTVTMFATAFALAPLYAMWRWAFSFINGFEIGVYALSGFMFPVTQLPQWLQAAAWVIAPAWATRSLYAAAGEPFGASFVAWWAAALGLSAAYLLVAWFLFRVVDVRARVTGQLALV